MDGICNRLFLFAHSITCAQEHQFRVRHAAFSEFFEGTASQLVPSFPGTTTSSPDRLRRIVSTLLGRLIAAKASQRNSGCLMQ
jgi:hypothetical protein